MNDTFIGLGYPLFSISHQYTWLYTTCHFRVLYSRLVKDQSKYNEMSEDQSHAESGDQTVLNKVMLKLPDYDRS